MRRGTAVEHCWRFDDGHPSLVDALSCPGCEAGVEPVAECVVGVAADERLRGLIGH